MGRYGLETVHPEYEIVKNDEFKPQILAKYPLTKGITHQKMRKLMSEAIELIKEDKIEVTDLMPAHNFSNLNESIINVHAPDPKSDIDDFLVGGKSEARKRIGLEEMVANKISYLSIREKNKNRITSAFKNNKLAKEINAGLAFKLTDDQVSAYEEISADIATQTPMLRLLQGDVGSGKTIVALAGLFHTAGSLKQGAMMAPTELLARQHYEGIRDLCLKSNVSVNILTGKTKQKDREIILKDLKEGKIDIIIGTHALFQEKVLFNDLGLVVIDEQHRFGVHQRLSLTSKSKDYPPDILIMSATPIPRTLELTAFGSMQVSRLLDKPKGRKPIKTIAKPINKISEVIDSIERLINVGEKIYWVCPLIEESEKIDLAAAEDRFHQLNKIYKDKVALVHGKMKIEDREKVMNDFKYGSKMILAVSYTHLTLPTKRIV